MSDKKLIILSIVGIASVLIISIAGVFGVSATYKWYKVWSYERDGQAHLAKAEATKLIMLEEAKAKRLAAKELAAAEVERAKGVAEANRIIGNSLRKNEAYLRYLWIMGLHDGNSETIYIPTEGQLPILEATRRKRARPLEK